MSAAWKTGVITVPSSTGSVAVTGLGGTPRAVFFYGTNWLTEDAAVTTTGTGMFRGMAAPQYNSLSTIAQHASCISPAGVQHVSWSNAIRMLTTAGSTVALYSADVSSFDPDGFTLGFFDAAAGGYKIVYVALMGVTNAAGFVGTTTQSGLAFGFKPDASLLHGAWGGPDTIAATRTQEFYGGAAYPTVSSANWMSAGMSAIAFPTASNQHDSSLTIDPPTTNVTHGNHFVGPSMVSDNIRAFPSGTGLTDFTFDGTSGGADADGGMVVAWDDNDSATGAVSIPPNTGNTVTVSGLPFSPGLVLFYTTSNEPQGQAGGGATTLRGGNGFGVATPSFQWCSVVDGISSRGSFQSFQRGFVDCVSGTNVHAGTVAFTANGFVLTTEEDDVAGGSLIWHAFGYPETGSWLPHIYRRAA